MRAFTIGFAGAMACAVSLATLGAISTVSQNRHYAAAFSLTGGSAFARKAYDGQPARAAIGVPIAPTDAAHAGKATARNDVWGPLRTTD